MCDTTSGLFGKGKANLLKMIQNSDSLNQTVQFFEEEIVCPDDIDAAGEKFLIALYGASGKVISFDSIRYQHFMRSATKSKMNLASLPLTAKAARQHSFRAYLQVQTWYGVMQNLED